MRAVRLFAVPVVLAVALAAAPGAAQASIIGGSLDVQPPSGGFPALINDDVGSPPADHEVTLTGSAQFDGSPVASTDIGCYTASRTGVVSAGTAATGVPLDGGGAFSTTVDGRSLNAPCLMGVLVGSAGPMPPAQVFGSVLYTAIVRTTRRAIGPPNDGAIKTVTIKSLGVQGGSTIADPDNGTPLALAPVEEVGAVPSPRNLAWSGSGQILDAANLPGSRSSVTVDGKNAYTSGEEAQIDDAVPGLKGLTIDRFAHLGNAISTTMTEPFLTCPAPCTAYQDAGIALRRTAETNATNRVMTVTDEWSSTDGAPHALDILLQYEVGGGDPEFSLPWIDGGAFKTYTGGTVAPPTARVNTIYEHNTVGDPGDTSGTLTLSARPASMKFTGNTSFQLQFLRSLPATGSVKIVSTYTASTGAVDAASVAAAEAAANAASPRVTITSPASSGSPSYTATGAASSPAGVASVTVNGTAAKVAADGTWSAPLTLKAGVNPVSAVLTDGDGATDTTTATVTYTPSVGGAATAAQAAFGTKPLFKKGVLTLNLGCTGQPGQTCAVGVLLTAPKAKGAARSAKAKPVTLLKRTLAIPVGAIRPVRVKLPKSALKRIPKGRGLKTQLVLTQGATTRRFGLTLRR